MKHHLTLPARVWLFIAVFVIAFWTSAYVIGGFTLVLSLFSVACFISAFILAGLGISDYLRDRRLERECAARIDGIRAFRVEIIRLTTILKAEGKQKEADGILNHTPDVDYLLANPDMMNWESLFLKGERHLLHCAGTGVFSHATPKQGL